MKNGLAPQLIVPRINMMEFTTKYVSQKGGRGHYAVVTLRVEADEPGIVNAANLEEALFAGLVEGLGDLAKTFKITLLDAKLLDAIKVHEEWPGPRS